MTDNLSNEELSAIKVLVQQMYDCAATYADEDGIGEPGMLLCRGADRLSVLLRERGSAIAARDRTWSALEKLTRMSGRVSDNLHEFGDLKYLDGEMWQAWDDAIVKACIALQQEKNNDQQSQR